MKKFLYFIVRIKANRFSNELYISHKYKTYEEAVDCADKVALIFHKEYPELDVCITRYENTEVRMPWPNH